MIWQFWMNSKSSCFLMRVYIFDLYCFSSRGHWIIRKDWMCGKCFPFLCRKKISISFCFFILRIFGTLNDLKNINESFSILYRIRKLDLFFGIRNMQDIDWLVNMHFAESYISKRKIVDIDNRTKFGDLYFA